MRDLRLLVWRIRGHRVDMRLSARAECALLPIEFDCFSRRPPGGVVQSFRIGERYEHLMQAIPLRACWLGKSINALGDRVMDAEADHFELRFTRAELPKLLGCSPFEIMGPWCPIGETLRIELGAVEPEGAHLALLAHAQAVEARG